MQRTHHRGTARGHRHHRSNSPTPPRIRARWRATRGLICAAFEALAALVERIVRPPVDVVVPIRKSACRK
jgi:hypothetical protein